MPAPIAPIPTLREPRPFTCRMCVKAPEGHDRWYCAVIDNTTSASTRACLTRGARKR